MFHFHSLLLRKSTVSRDFGSFHRRRGCRCDTIAESHVIKGTGKWTGSATFDVSFPFEDVLHPVSAMLASFSPVPSHDTMVRFFLVYRPMLDKDAQPHLDNRRLRIMMGLYQRIQYIFFQFRRYGWPDSLLFAFPVCHGQAYSPRSIHSPGKLPRFSVGEIQIA